MIMGDQVECRSDYDYAQRPVAFYWQGNRLEVAEIIWQARNPSGISFQVCVEEAGVFELIYDINADQWSIEQL